MKRRIVWVWLVAMLLAVWPAENGRSTDPMLLSAVVDDGIEEHRPRLATIVETQEESLSILRRGAHVESSGYEVASIQRPRVCTVRRTARGPPRGASSARCMKERAMNREEKTC